MKVTIEAEVLKELLANSLSAQSHLGWDNAISSDAPRKSHADTMMVLGAVANALEDEKQGLCFPDEVGVRGIRLQFQQEVAS